MTKLWHKFTWWCCLIWAYTFGWLIDLYYQWKISRMLKK